MTNEQKEHIAKLRRDGLGYGKISKIVNISINTIKTFCRRNGLTDKMAEPVCEQCGKPVLPNTGRKRKRFCSDSCRNAWWNSHLYLVKRKANYTITCLGCGREFTVYGNRNRKYCSHNCYVAHRFYGDVDE